MAKEQIAVAELVLNMILGKTGGTRVDYFPQKPDFPFDAVYEQAFVRATPESQGISSDLFAALLRELDASKDTEMHHFMALRHGKVICECNFAPYPKGMWHITHSMCKSITGMAIESVARRVPTISMTCRRLKSVFPLKKSTIGASSHSRKREG